MLSYPSASLESHSITTQRTLVLTYGHCAIAEVCALEVNVPRSKNLKHSQVFRPEGENCCERLTISSFILLVLVRLTSTGLVCTF
jgi:hypothetical protein